jgi:hypothetical protein
MSATMERAETTAASGLGRALRWVSVVTAALVIVQAILAGQWLAGSTAVILTHGWIGNVAYLGALAMVVIGFLGWRRGWGVACAGFPVLLTVLMTAQLGLGYVGRKQAWAAGIHLTGGVIITALLVWIIALAWLRPGRERA